MHTAKAESQAAQLKLASIRQAIGPSHCRCSKHFQLIGLTVRTVDLRATIMPSHQSVIGLVEVDGHCWAASGLSGIDNSKALRPIRSEH